MLRKAAIEILRQKVIGDWDNENDSDDWNSGHSDAAHLCVEIKEDFQLVEAEEPKRRQVLSHDDAPKLKPKTVHSDKRTEI